jgi:phosphoribosyl 1,2-cyclic phosphodiesterase
MHIQVFGSSSAGNCVRIYTDDNAGVYLDAGIRPKQILAAGAPLANATILLTHEHGDHAAYAKEISDKYGAMIFTTQETFDQIEQNNQYKISGRHKVHVRPADRTYSRNGCKFIAFPVIHYPAVNPVGWIIKIGSENCLYMTDVGQIPNYQFPKCDVYFIEANYTPDRLAQNIYSSRSAQYVAERTASGFGHIGIMQAIEFMMPRASEPCLFLLGHRSSANFDMDEALDLMPMDILKKTRFVEPGQTYSTIPF